MNIEFSPFGRTTSGEEVDQFTLTNDQGYQITIITYGAILASCRTPDRTGRVDEITLGFDSLEGYLGEHPYFGATIGRCANRIDRGRFTLQGREYTLYCNNGPHHLHGGKLGFDRKVWAAKACREDDRVSVTLTATSPDGDEGYPGNLQVSLTYTLTAANELIFSYTGDADQATPVNLTNHTYWNLTGDGLGTIDDHELEIRADQVLEVDPLLIPTGQLLSLAGTPFDFNHPKAIGQDVELVNGYDQSYVLRPASSPQEPAARVFAPASGRQMEVFTDQPALQFYSGNFLDGTLTGRGGDYQKRGALCLEASAYVDATNQPNFPTVILQPGETYRQTTSHRFSSRK